MPTVEADTCSLTVIVNLVCYPGSIEQQLMCKRNVQAIAYGHKSPLRKALFTPRQA
jgi:hypothetical protein